MEAADPSPWKKLDPSKLRREAEAKEAKLKRQQEQRIARAEARKEKRHIKSEAKKARKANVGRAAKWNPERRAADKLKKLANRPHKQEKRRKRLRLRAEKLEQQAHKLMNEAQRARARADFLDEQKEKEEEEKGQLTREISQMAADPNDDNYIPLDGTAPASTTSSTTDSESDDDSTSSEEEPKKKRDKGKKKAEKKRKRKAEDDEDDDEHQATNGTVEADDAVEVEAPKEEKKKKKRKLEHAAEETEPQEGAEQSEPRKEKKEKKDKKDKKKKRKEKDHTEEYVSSTPIEGGASTNGGEQWNVEALEGNEKRKEKFLRLLGGKKPNGGATADGYNAPSTSRSNITQVQHDLERQFDTGMRMKHDGHGQKKGLGA